MNSTKLGIENLQEFKNILDNNKGIIIIKLGAEWCKPCCSIEPLIKTWFNKMNLINSVQTVLVDIDENFEFYSYLKNKKMLKGIPAILMYKKGNCSYICDDSVNNSNVQEIDNFFRRCIEITK